MNNMTESNPDRFFENIPETEEATFMFDDASLRAARCIQKKKNTKKKFSILNKCINKCKKNDSDYGWD